MVKSDEQIISLPAGHNSPAQFRNMDELGLRARKLKSGRSTRNARCDATTSRPLRAAGEQGGRQIRSLPDRMSPGRAYRGKWARRPSESGQLLMANTVILMQSSKSICLYAGEKYPKTRLTC
jgi:hypothetical protein